MTNIAKELKKLYDGPEFQVPCVECRKNDKKPSDVLLGATVDASPLVTGEQERFDEAESERDELERIYNVFGNAHIHFRAISKGSF